MIDLHIHTIFSDGTNTPEEIILLAKEKGLKAIAISDHDTLNGLEQAKYFGKINNIEVINGIEFSADFNGKEIHILGYFLDDKNENLLKELKKFEKTRDERNIQLIKKFEELNLDIDLDYVKSLAGNNILTKLHFAKAIFEKGYTSSIKEAFSLYLAENKPAYIKRQLINYEDAIKLILNAGGICSLAHPYVYKYSEKELEENIKILKEKGLQCIECYYSGHTRKQTNTLLKYCEKFDLETTAGSDFHGENKSYVSFGEIFLGEKVDYKILETLKNKFNYS